MPQNYGDAIEKLCQYRKVAFVIEKGFNFDRQCKIEEIPTPISFTWLGYAVRKNSSYRSIFNRM